MAIGQSKRQQRALVEAYRSSPRNLTTPVRTLPPEAAIEAYEAALALYRGDLLDSSDVPSYRWTYDEGPQVSLTLCGDYRRLQREARLRLAGLLGAGDKPGLARAEELYTGLCAE